MGQSPLSSRDGPQGLTAALAFRGARGVRVPCPESPRCCPNTMHVLISHLFVTLKFKLKQREQVSGHVVCSSTCELFPDPELPHLAPWSPSSSTVSVPPTKRTIGKLPKTLVIHSEAGDLAPRGRSTCLSSPDATSWSPFWGHKRCGLLCAQLDSSGGRCEAGLMGPPDPRWAPPPKSLWL